jgi:two-component system chemotaxis response regulator CheY
MSENPRILLIEDTQSTRSLLAALIREITPAKIIECQNGLEAIKILPHTQVDLIVTDLNMPDINGLELIRFLKSNKSFSQVPLIVVTTEASPRERQKTLALGVDAYFTKPFSTSEFQKAVLAFLKKGS